MKKSSVLINQCRILLIFALSFFAGQNSFAKTCEFLADAPAKYEVSPGDTLWDISTKFLEKPWCWPQVWDLNQEQVHNPHRIYPGQIIYLDRTNNRLRLSATIAANATVVEGNTTTVRLSPNIRSTKLAKEIIPSIPTDVIEPFLSQPLIIQKDDFAHTPKIVATPEARLFLGRNDLAYVQGNLKDATSFQVLRAGKALNDPDTNEILGYEAISLGIMKLQKPAKTENDLHTLIVVNAKQEISVGDYIVPVPQMPIINYVPHRSEKPITAKIMSVYGGVLYAGQKQIVSINRGKDDGVDVGTVLTLSRFGKKVSNPLTDNKEIKLPNHEYGSLFVFLVFNKISYGLIMQVTDAATIGDVASSPD